MYTGDKSHRITLRLNESQFDFVRGSADILGVSPSDFLRMVINIAMASNNLVPPDVVEEVTAKSIEEVIRRENEKTDNDSQL